MAFLIKLHQENIAYKFIEFNNIPLIVSSLKRMDMRFYMHTIIYVIKLYKFTRVGK